MENIQEILKALADGQRTKHYPKGQIILYQGDPPVDALILTDGIIKIHDIDKQGNEKILHIVKPFGLVPFALFSGTVERPINWFYTALTDADVCVLPFEKLEEYMEKDSQLAIHLMNWFSQEVHELLVRLSSLGKTNAKGKILAALKFLAVHHSTLRRSGWSRINFPVNHQLLADMTGVTRESAAAIMKELSDDHIVRNPRLTILEISSERLYGKKKTQAKAAFTA
jgi:CRP-like cAMP-binding protein